MIEIYQEQAVFLKNYFLKKTLLEKDEERDDKDKHGWIKQIEIRIKEHQKKKNKHNVRRKIHSTSIEENIIFKKSDNYNKLI